MNPLDMILKAVQPIQRRVQLMVGRGSVKSVKDSGGLQTLQIQFNPKEVRADIERVQNFGLTSFPDDGSEAVTIFIGGNRDHGLTVAVDNRKLRPKDLNKGETCLYNSKGVKILLAESKNVEVTGISKFKVQNESHELIKVLSDLVQAIIDARTETALGPMPLLNADDPFPEIKNRLDTFKE